jgi:hypothetical protein
LVKDQIEALYLISNGQKAGEGRGSPGIRVPVVGGEVAVLAMTRKAFGGLQETTAYTTVCNMKR